MHQMHRTSNIFLTWDKTHDDLKTNQGIQRKQYPVRIQTRKRSEKIIGDGYLMCGNFGLHGDAGSSSLYESDVCIFTWLFMNFYC